MSDRRPQYSIVRIVDVDMQSPAPAILTRHVDPDLLFHVELQWRKPRKRLGAILLQEGISHEHGHWQWTDKYNHSLPEENVVFALTCAGWVQGMMGCHVDRTVPEIYVNYLETAPWNIRPISGHRQYSAVGTVLLMQAVELSRSLGFNGRLSLHSLAQSESFYRDRIGMIDCGPDPHYQNMHRFVYNLSDSGGLRS